MDILALLSQPHLDWAASAARLLFSMVACGIIGMEREARRQTAGLRTHIIIGLGATLLMLLSIWVPQELAPGQDPARIAAQVVSGIGFLGAGAFIKIGNNVKGLTTAASLWFVAALGLVVGAGMWQMSLVGLGLAMLVLVGFERVERHFFPPERLKLLRVSYEGAMPKREAVVEVLKRFDVPMYSFDASLELSKKQSDLSMLVKAPENLDLDGFFGELRKTGKVARIRLREDF